LRKNEHAAGIKVVLLHSRQVVEQKLPNTALYTLVRAGRFVGVLRKRTPLGSSLRNKVRRMKYWQESMLDNLTSYFESDEDVLGLLLFGSFSKPDFHLDAWSDLDLLVVVKDNRLGSFFPTTEWINHFGRLYTYSQSSDDFKYTTRACFENFNRVDFVITTEGKLVDIRKWSSIPFYPGVKVIFSRSKVVDEIAIQNYSQPELPLITQEQFLEMVRNFRFKSMLAIYKVVRNDLLIALHLAQDLVRDCCVLEMMLRDRATGTNIHKHGGIGNQFITELEVTQKPSTSIGILDSIKESNEIFEKLAHEWSSDYQENRQPLLDWIEQAKGTLRL
jgi:predicted nucleotidyltransferase